MLAKLSPGVSFWKKCGGQLIPTAGKAVTRRQLLEKVWGPTYTNSWQSCHPASAFGKSVGANLYQRKPISACVYGTSPPKTGSRSNPSPLSDYRTRCRVSVEGRVIKTYVLK